MSLVVDASVAIKWFVEEIWSDAARAVLGSGEPLIAPDLVVPEACNAAIPSTTASTSRWQRASRPPWLRTTPRSWRWRGGQA